MNPFRRRTPTPVTCLLCEMGEHHSYHLSRCVCWCNLPAPLNTYVLPSQVSTASGSVASSPTSAASRPVETGLSRTLSEPADPTESPRRGAGTATTEA